LVAKTLENACSQNIVVSWRLNFLFFISGIDSPLVSYAHAQHPNIQAYTCGSDDCCDESEDALTYVVMGCNATLENDIKALYFK
jgi:hypothetical protein